MRHGMEEYGMVGMTWHRNDMVQGSERSKSKKKCSKRTLVMAWRDHRGMSIKGVKRAVVRYHKR